MSFPDFPGCITAGKTLEEARRFAAEALALHIKGMLEDGEKIPEPSTRDALAGDAAIKDAAPVESPDDETVRINSARQAQLGAKPRRSA